MQISAPAEELRFSRETGHRPDAAFRGRYHDTCADRVRRAFTRSLAYLATGMALVWIVTRAGGGAQPAAAIALAAFLAVGWEGRKTEEWILHHQRAEAARIYAAAFKGRTTGSVLGYDAGFMSGRIGSAFQALVAAIRNALLRRDELASWAFRMQNALAASVSEGNRLVATLNEDAYAISAFASRTRKAHADLSEAVAALKNQAVRAAATAAATAGEAGALAESARTIALQTNRAAAEAMRMRDGVIAIRTRAARVTDTVSGLVELAEDGAPGLSMAVRALLKEAAELRIAVDGIGQSVLSQADGADAMMAAIRQQGTAIGRLTARLDLTQTEMSALQDCAEQLNGGDGLAAQKPGPAADGAIERLPNYGNAIAQILKGLPAFHDADA